MKAVDPRVSFAELSEWPEDGRRYELYDGEVSVVPAPAPRHQRVSINIEALLLEYERATSGLMLHSPLDIVFSDYDVVQPDVVFFRKDRRHLIDVMQPIRIPPDLAVEVLSPGTAARDRGRKMQMLARFGVPEYWIADPIAHILEIYALAASSYQLAGPYGEHQEVVSPTLAGLSFNADRIFDE